MALNNNNDFILDLLLLQRVKEYLVDSSLVSKLQAKHDLLKVAVEKGTKHFCNSYIL